MHFVGWIWCEETSLMLNEQDDGED